MRSVFPIHISICYHCLMSSYVYGRHVLNILLLRTYFSYRTNTGNTACLHIQLYKFVHILLSYNNSCKQVCNTL